MQEKNFKFFISGHVLAANGAGIAAGASASIDSPFYSLTPGSQKGHCFTFWYRGRGSSSNGTLSVTIRYGADGQREPFNSTVWSVQKTFLDAWEYAAISVGSPQFRARFSVQNDADSLYVIDDVAPTVEPCPPVLTCYFEESTCGWINGLEDDMDWVRISPRSALFGMLPTTDHSTESEYGNQENTCNEKHGYLQWRV